MHFFDRILHPEDCRKKLYSERITIGRTNETEIICICTDACTGIVRLQHSSGGFPYHSGRRCDRGYGVKAGKGHKEIPGGFDANRRSFHGGFFGGDHRGDCFRGRVHGNRANILQCILIHSFIFEPNMSKLYFMFTLMWDCCTILNIVTNLHKFKKLIHK